jgi:peptide/nickel transport system permease protein
MTAGQLFGRLLQALLTLLAVSFLVYILIGLMPGDPVDLMAAGNPHITPEDIARLRAEYGLDQPLLERYWRWLAKALTGDLGYSRLYNLPVLQVIGPRALNTAVLLGAALAFTVALALPLGVQAARKPGGFGDRLINTACLCGISVPTFWFALLLICLFSVALGWLPASASISDGPLLLRLKSLILPILAIAISDAATYIRHTRTSMIEALRADHIRTARAKGCAESRVVWVHAFKNALPPIVTIFMLDLGTLIGGAATIEMIFGYPGMGKLMIDAVNGNDYNLALTEFLILTVFVIAANFVADGLYAVLDPRVNLTGKK